MRVRVFRNLTSRCLSIQAKIGRRWLTVAHASHAVLGDVTPPVYNHFVFYTVLEHGQEVRKRLDCGHSMRRMVREAERLKSEGARDIKCMWTRAETTR